MARPRLEGLLTELPVPARVRPGLRRAHRQGVQGDRAAQRGLHAGVVKGQRQDGLRHLDADDHDEMTAAVSVWRSQGMAASKPI